MGKMKILFFSHYFYPEGNAPASRVYEMAKEWVKSGHEVTVITCAPNVPDGIVYDGYKNRWRSKETIDGIEVVRVWTYLAANKGTFKRMLNFVSYMVMAIFAGLFRKRPDVVIATSPQFFCGWAGVIVSKLRRLPFILEIRDLWPESIIAVGANLGKRTIRILEKLEDWMYRSADQIVTVGEGYKQRLLEKRVPDSKIRIIMNGLNTELFVPTVPDQTLIEEWGLTGKFICSYSGTIGMACGLEVVIDAAEQLKKAGDNEVIFLLVGDGAHRADLEAQAKTKKLDNVIFTGRQPKSLMPAFLSVSDVSLVHLKKSDLFTTVIPSKIFESAGMSCPILCGVPGFASKLVKDANAGLIFESEDAEGLLDGLIQLKTNNDLAKNLGKSGREFMLQHFDRKKLATDYLNIIQSMVN